MQDQIFGSENQEIHHWQGEKYAPYDEGKGGDVMRQHNFWETNSGELVLLVITFITAVILTFVIARVNMLFEAGLLFPVLLTIIFVLLSSLFRHRHLY